MAPAGLAAGPDDATGRAIIGKSAYDPTLESRRSNTMRFAFGFLAGVIVGAAGAVLYSVQTGRDLREEYAGVRADIQNRDLEALGARLETRMREIQSMVEERVAQAREATEEADVAAEAALEAAEDVGDAIAEAAAEGTDQS
jgi:gas vesicle protein